jgi:cytochrome o ubiquinol oxidase subunit II
MPAMKTQLHLIANEKGDFRGSSANLSGAGFSGMNFIARASSEEDYKKWIDETKQSSHQLGQKEYEVLARPSENTPPEVYQLTDKDLFEQIVMKYMHPPKTPSSVEK